MLNDRLVKEAELAFLNAPFADDGWHQAVRVLAAATGSDIAQLCGSGQGPGLSFNIFSDDRHDPHGHLDNPLLYGAENWRVGVTMQARQIQFERDYAVYRAHHQTGYYDDAISDLDLPFGCQSALLLDSNGMFGLALLRSARNGRTTPEALAAFTSVARQAYRAVRVQMALGEEAATMLLSGLDRCQEATLLLDGHSNVLAMTEAAEALFDHPAGLRLSGLAVTLADPAEARSLAAAGQRLLASDGLSGPILHEVRVGRSADRPQGRWRALLVRIGGPTSILSVEPQLALTLAPC